MKSCQDYRFIVKVTSRLSMQLDVEMFMRTYERMYKHTNILIHKYRKLILYSSYTKYI